MPRNASGIYTLPGGNPVTPGDVIEADWANTTLEDVADALTNSLSRTGAGGMLAPFRIADGNVSGPGLSYLNETNTGLYRSGSGSTWMAVLGVNVAQFSTVGLTVAAGKALTVLGNASASGTLSITGATTLASTLAVTGAITATGGVVGNVTGNVTAASGTSTFNDVVVTGALDMTAGSSATITGLSTPTNASDAANKGYVDTQDALRLALTGGTMSGAIAMGNSKITGLATPTADADAATKAYVDSVAQGLDVKGSCRVGTTANITLSGTQTIDGVAVIAGDRVLVKNQSSAAENGIYVVAAGSWSRAADADTWNKLVGAFTFVEEGTVNDNSGWVCTSPAGGTLGVTAVTWEQFSGAGQITAGAGMYKSGNTLNVGTASSARIVVGTDDIDLATTGVTASTYKSVTVDVYGRVTGGTNPTTLAGFGITDAYTQAQVDAALALKLNLTGGTMSGAIAMGANKITGLADPTLAKDAATKNYIDTIFGSTTTAAASAAAAAASASAASTSATNASNSATAAAGSATSAAASFTAFDNQYLGSKASDPSTNNTGGALVEGNLYWNSTANEMRVYDGAAWVAAYLPASGYAQLAAANVFTANQTISANTSSAALSITQAGSGNALYIEDVAADATPFVVSSTGAVGIGTTTPDNVTSAGIALVSNDGYYPQVVNRNKANDANASYVVFDKDRAGAVVQSGDSLGNILFRSFDGSSYLQSAAIIGYSDGTPGANDVPGRLAFLTTADGAAAPTERFRIAGTGAWGLSGANYGSAGQVLTSNGSGSAPSWQAAGGGGSAATPTALGTVYGTTTAASAYNTGLGYSALPAITSGTNNVAIGREAGNATTSGASNVFVGPFSGYVNTSGNGLVAIGNNALVSNTTGSYNVGVGQQALAANTTGVESTAVGYRALVANTTGDYNVAIGRDASRASTTAQRNTFVGSYSAVGITTGSYNTAVGFDAGAGTTTGVENTFMGLSAGGSGNGSGVVGIGYQAGRGGGNYGVWIGYNAGQATSNTGAHNVGLGFYAGVSNSTGSSNIFIGYQTGGSNTTGANNVFIGSEAGNATGAGMANTTASNNVAIGASALRSNTTASQNTAVGYQAGYSTTTATGQTFVGDKAGRLATGEWNTCIGLQAGENITTGVQNTMIGAYNGNYVTQLTTGSYNITLGTYSGPSASNSNYELVIGYNVRGKGSSTGFISPNGGGVYQGNNSSSWSTTSDRRLKKNIVNNDVGLEKLTQIQVRNFEYRLPDEVDAELKPTDAINKTGVQLGVIAQELQAVLPECVKQESTGVLSVDTDNLTWYLINAVKELSARVKQLEGN